MPGGIAKYLTAAARVPVRGVWIPGLFQSRDLVCRGARGSRVE